ncbi:hypothetical protein ACFE04_031318 [Oxalis oulophora]
MTLSEFLEFAKTKVIYGILINTQFEYEEDDEMRKFNRGLDFHLQCIKLWLDRKNTCHIVMFQNSLLMGGGRSNLNDRFKNLRLDIDNMTYDELLQLDDKIGNSAIDKMCRKVFILSVISENWEWEGDDCFVQKTSNMGVSESSWGVVNLDEDDPPYMLEDERTPVKACDLSYHVLPNDNMNKEPPDRRETGSQTKRRRTLHFGDQVADSTLCNEDMSSVLLKSNERDDSVEEATQWPIGFSEAVSLWGSEGLDQASEDWLAGCFNDTDMHDDTVISGSSSAQTDCPDVEYSNAPSGSQTSTMGQRITITSRNVVFKGKKTFTTPTKLVSSVAYPFAFVKPCDLQGGVTLNEINQKIRTPPPSKKKDKEPVIVYPTSAFSGKPVVGKTKIRTEGGKDLMGLKSSAAGPLPTLTMLDLGDGNEIGLDFC